MEFKTRLKELRLLRKMSQSDLAKELNVSKSLIGLWENGVRQPSREKLEAIADYFNVTIDYLVGKEIGSVYYLDPKAAEYAEFLHKSPEYRILFDAVRDVPAEDIEFVKEMIDRMKK